MNFKSMIIMAGASLVFASCHHPVFDYEGDCEVNYYMSFVYDMNLKWADAFPSEVNSVNLYAFDENGIFVEEFTAGGEEVSRPGYLLHLDMPAGEYQLLAWCGLDSESGDGENFTVTQPVKGVTRIEEMTCRLRTESLTRGEEYSDMRLNFLYHGYMTVSLPDSQDGRDYYYTMLLTKDTNHIRVMLQQVSDDISAEDFNISLTSANGEMAYNNAIIGDTDITYLPWYTDTNVLGVGNKDGVITEYTGVIADLSTCRMMMADMDEMRLNVRNKDNSSLIFSVPIIQYSLTAKKYYEEAYGHRMTDQEFLDRQDEYMLTFFLDEDMKWIYTIIDILSWRVIIRNYEVGN